MAGHDEYTPQKPTCLDMAADRLRRNALAFEGDLMSAINLDLHSDFRRLLLVAALVWIAGFVLHIARR